MPNPESALLVRLILYSGEVYRVPEAARGIRVRRGQAWVSFAGRDVIAGRGAVTWLAPGQDFALISPVGSSALVVEILAGDAARPPAPEGLLAQPA